MSALAVAPIRLSHRKKPIRGPRDQQWDRAMRLVLVMWMLLQAGESGPTAAELSEVLPIGGRTVLRDIDALENGGIPVQRVWVPVGRDVRRRYVLMLDAHQRAAAARLAVVCRVAQ